MALAIKDRVKETSTTTGTGTYTLGGAVTGFETFTANLSNADTTYYACTDNTDFEVGIGTFTSSGTTLARTTILASSNSNSAVNWSSGTRTIFMTYPADKAVFKDASDNINGTFVGNITGNVTGNTSGTAATVTTAAQSNITSLGTLTTLTVDNVIINGTTIGHTDDTDLITLADGVATVAGEISVTTLDIGGTNVTSTAAELNVLDGIASIDTDISSVSGSDDTLASAKAIKTYVDAKVTAEDLDVTSDSGTIAIDLDSETLTIAGGTGLASSATSNTVTLAVDAAQTGITSLLATDIKIGEDDQTKIDFETADTINFYAGNEKQLVLTDGALTPGTNAILDLGTDALEFKDAYFDGTVEADAITIGGTGIGSIYSAIAGSSSIVTTGALNSGSITSGFGTIDTGSSAITTTGLISGGSLDIDDVLINGTTIGHTDDTDLITLADGVVTVAGELDATTLDISGNADIDGTLYADAISNAGNLTFESETSGIIYTSAGNSDPSILRVGNNTTTYGFNIKYMGSRSGNANSLSIFTDQQNTGLASLEAFTMYQDGSIGLNDTSPTHRLDVNGTFRATGAATFDSTLGVTGALTVGVDDTGHDVKFFGATSGAYIQWDESADKLLTAGGAVVDIVKDKLLIGGTAVTTTAAELNVLDAVTAGTVTASLAVVVDSNKDIGSFRNVTLTGELDAATGDFSGDVDVDGTLEADAITVNGSTLNSVIADEATALAIALG